MTTLPVSIRKAVPGDIHTLVAFNQAMARETEDRHLPDARLLAGVEKLFQNPHYGYYLIAEIGGEVVGCLMITYEWSDWRNGLCWWIQSVYVKPAYRRRGVYTRLYEHIKQQAADDGGICGFRLYVERENHVARRTYTALGMQEAYYIMYEEMLVE